MHKHTPIDLVNEAQVNVLLSIFSCVALFFLSWGSVLQFARIFGLPLPITGHLATSLSIASIFIFLRFFNEKHFGNLELKNAGYRSLKKVFLLALIVSIYRLFHFVESSDSLQYLIGAAHHSSNLSLPLGFNMPGHLSDDKLNLYFLSQVPEYLFGYLSIYLNLNITILYFHLMPSFATFLGTLSISLIFFALGASEKKSVFLTFCVVCALLLNFGDAYFGEWAIRRTETTRSFFNAFVLNLILCVVLLKYRFSQIALTPLVFIFSAGFSLTSQTLPFLVVLSATLMWCGIFLQKFYHEKTFQFPHKDVFLAFVTPALFFIVIAHYTTDVDLYSYQLEGWEIRKLYNYRSGFLEHWQVVFGEGSIPFIIFISTIGLHSIFLRNIGRQPLSVFLYIYSLIYLFGVLNPISFEIISILSNKYVVYFRFFYLFPVLIYPFVLFSIYGNESFKAQMLRRVPVVIRVFVSIVLGIFVLLGLKNFWITTIKYQFKSAQTELAPSITASLIASASGEDLKGKTLLTFRYPSLKHGVFTTDLILLVSKNQLLPLYRSPNKSKLLDSAQFALSGSLEIDETHLESLDTVLNTYAPNFVISKTSKPNTSGPDKVITTNDYLLILQKGDQNLFVKRKL